MILDLDRGIKGIDSHYFFFSMVNKVMKAKMVEVYVCVCITIVFVDDA